MGSELYTLFFCILALSITLSSLLRSNKYIILKIFQNITSVIQNIFSLWWDLYTFFLYTRIFLIKLSILLRSSKYTMLEIFWKITFISFKSGRTRAIWKWRTWLLNIFWIFFSRWVMLLSNKILWENSSNDLLNEDWPKMLILGFLLLIVPGNNLS